MSEDSVNRAFPLDVIQVPGGWGIVVYLRNGQEWNLMKPGWQEERHTPYVFQTDEDAWRFLKRLFLFCLQQRHLQFRETDKVMNCEECGRVFRARYFRVCGECLQKNEFMMQQIWQGFYYMTGSQEAALEKMSLLLKIPIEQCAQIPLAFNDMVKCNLNWHLQWEKEQLAKAQPEETPASAPSGMRHRRRE